VRHSDYSGFSPRLRTPAPFGGADRESRSIPMPRSDLLGALTRLGARKATRCQIDLPNATFLAVQAHGRCHSPGPHLSTGGLAHGAARRPGANCSGRISFEMRCGSRIRGSLGAASASNRERQISDRIRCFICVSDLNRTTSLSGANNLRDQPCEGSGRPIDRARVEPSCLAEDASRDFRRGFRYQQTGIRRPTQ